MIETNWKYYLSVFATMFFAPMLVSWLGLVTWTPGLYLTLPKIFIYSFLLFVGVYFLFIKKIFTVDEDEELEVK